ncbi:MAG TPA: hypothetical protein VIM12_06630 [Noviherbaspirillum sp.]|jgi:hypothetical protein|uniref:hypothetical protein n=1 Tax=Noviherbaspirillum sp. TaxID=1926288 RepID=UPI002F938F76
MTLDPKLKEWATARQADYIDAVAEHGSMRTASRALKVAYNSVADAIALVKRKAAAAGYSPEHAMTRPVPDRFVVKGVSTYYDEDGKARGQWVKSAVDRDRMQEIMRQAVAAMCEDIAPQAPIPAPMITSDKLANVYTLTDSHVGTLAWHRENLQADWDLKIAERTLTGCFEYMINASPAAKVGIVAQLGDFLHSDGLAAVTPTSGHLLDQDGRFQKVVQAAIRILRRVVNLALGKYEKVVVLMAEGNHDLASSVWLRAMFQTLYENEPRVEVIDSELPYYVYQHGKTMLAWHHGHLKKSDGLPILFTSQFPKIWGNTEKRYAMRPPAPRRGEGAFRDNGHSAFDLSRPRCLRFPRRLDVRAAVHGHYLPFRLRPSGT